MKKSKNTKKMKTDRKQSVKLRFESISLKII